MKNPSNANHPEPGASIKAEIIVFSF